MMRVDVIVPYFYPPYIGGTETVLRKWNKYLSEPSGNEQVRFVLPFAYRSSDVFNSIGNCTFGLRIFNNRLMRLVGVLNLMFYLIFTEADNIVVLSPKYIRLSYMFRKIFHKHYRITNWIHFSLNQKFINDRKSIRLADYHLAISTGIKQQLLDMGIDKKDIFVVFNPIEPRKRVIAPSKSPKYIYVGRIEYRNQKNLQELIRGFSLVKEQLPNASLELWGDGEVDQLHKLVNKMHLSNVSFKGWNNDPYSEINCATAFVLTSTYEGLPMSILEAISYGVPVIASNIATGPADEITDDNGLLYEAGDLAELRDEMIELYKNRLKYHSQTIQSSINKYYVGSYFPNLIKILQEMGESHG